MALTSIVTGSASACGRHEAVQHQEQSGAQITKPEAESGSIAARSIHAPARLAAACAQASAPQPSPAAPRPAPRPATAAVAGHSRRRQIGQARAGPAQITATSGSAQKQRRRRDHRAIRHRARQPPGAGSDCGAGPARRQTLGRSASWAAASATPAHKRELDQRQQRRAAKVEVEPHRLIDRELDRAWPAARRPGSAPRRKLVRQIRKTSSQDAGQHARAASAPQGGGTPRAGRSRASAPAGTARPGSPASRAAASGWPAAG